MKRVLLLGGDIAAFAAALELAEVGLEVCVADPEVRVPRYDVRVGDGELSELLSELEKPLTSGAHGTPGAAAQTPPRPPLLLAAHDGKWRPAPSPDVWGLPTVPLSTECLGLYGTGGAFRAYLDRIKPVLTIGKEPNFGRLVDSRFGAKLRETSVEPHIIERFGVSAYETEVALVEPGLNEALTRAGSLSGAALLRADGHEAAERAVVPAAGWDGLGEILRERLRLYGATELPSEVVSCVPAEPAQGRAGADSRWAVTDAEGERHEFDAIVADPADLLRVLGAAGGATQRDAADTEPQPWSTDLSALASVPQRQFAELSVSAGVAAGEPAESDRLGTFRAADGSTWAVRLRRRQAGTTLLISSPATVAGIGPRLPVAEACAAVGIAAAPSDTVAVSVRAAAFATSAQRDAARARREAWAASHPSLLIAGEVLHGGELGHAVAAAKTQAVALRRTLTGISE